MRILVYPHAMELGGSQLNAIELAAAVRDRGHDVAVYAASGPLNEAVLALGLEPIPRRTSLVSPGPATALDLRRLVRERSIDIIHGYEWPPILEGHAAVAPPLRAAVVGTVMSMAIADFIPSSLPLFVGTRKLQDLASRSRSGPVHLMEPPIDAVSNRPGPYAAGFRRQYSTSATAQIVIVSRLARELKLEGILTAIGAVAELSQQRSVRLVIVGDGPARAEVERAAAKANDGLPCPVVLLTGELADPRGAYDSADICIGMGGSALRAMAFSKPLVVQGEGGFFETLTPGTVGTFLHQGWYGRTERNGADAVIHLKHLLMELLDAPQMATEIGQFGRRLVEERFSLVSAAASAEAVYQSAWERPLTRINWTLDAVAAAGGLVAHKATRRWQRLRGIGSRDDFNARPA